MDERKVMDNIKRISSKMDYHLGIIKWPTSQYDFFSKDEIKRVTAYILGINVLDVDETHISFLVDTYPQCLTLLSYHEITSLILTCPQIAPDGLIDDVVMEFINLLTEREKAPPLSLRLIRLLFHFKLLPEHWSLCVFDQIEVEYFRELFPIIHAISVEDGELLNNLFKMYELIHPDDTPLMLKLHKEQFRCLSSIVSGMDKLMTSTESFRYPWALNFIKEDRTSSQLYIRELIMHFLELNPQFPTDYTINDIIDHYGFVRPYRSRRELLDFYNEFLTGSLFTAFVILPKCKLKAENDKLYFLTDSIADIKDYLIGIGTMNNFSITTLDELVEVWSHGIENQCEYYQSPFSSTPMPKNIINIIFNIIILTNHLDALKTFQRVLVHIEECQGNEGRLRKDYLSLPSSEQSMVRKVVKQIFLAGMYMRRWDGYGSYPVEEESTETNEVFYDDLTGYLTKDEHEEEYEEEYELVLVKVSKELERLRILYNSLNPKGKEIIKRLHEYDIRTGDHKNRNFWSGIGKKTMKNEYCIRMASSVWIGTSASFFKLIKKETKFLRNFDLDSVVEIQ